MVQLREGLRPPKERPKKVPLTNAEKCKAYRQRLAQDDVRTQDAKLKKKAANKLYLLSLTPEQKELARERARLRMQKSRQNRKLKQQDPPNQDKAKQKKPSAKETRKTRQQIQKEAEKREKNRMSQKKRRANMSAQKKRREREKRREYYHQKKAREMNQQQNQAEKETNGKAKKSLSQLLKNAYRCFKRSRTKLGLFKLEFAKKLLSRENPTHTKSLRDYYKRSVYNNKLSVHNFLDKYAVDYPGKKGSSCQKKILSRSMADLYVEFKKLNPDSKLSLTTFKRRRPHHILLSSSKKFLQCLCEKCTNAKLLLEVVNSEIPKTTMLRVSCVERLLNKTLCENVKRSCVERECTECGVKDFFDRLEESIVDLDRERKWSQWEKTERSSKDLVFRYSSVRTVLHMLKGTIHSIAKHLKFAQWQRKQYQYLQSHLPRGHAMCTVDFAENYLCSFQDEVQSAHWSYKQVSVHPCVFFYRCGESGCQKVITDYFIVLSDDLKHDNAFTRHIFDLCISLLQKKGMKCIHIFSDGCSSQYKSRFTMSDLVNLQSKYSSIHLTRHFFGSGHGKSLCDSSGGTVKNAATRAVLSGSHVIQSAKALLDFCHERLVLSDSGTCLHHNSLRSFALVSSTDFDRTSSTVKSIKGIQSLHCMNPFTDKMEVRSLSCFCEVCLIGESGQCLNCEFVGEWQTVQVGKKDKAQSSVERTGLSDGDDFSEIGDSALDPSPVPHMTRDMFFKLLQENFTSCTTYEELQATVDIVLPKLSDYPLPSMTPSSIIDIGGTVDAVADKLVPDNLRPLYPVLVSADGNCIPRSLSVLCFGTELQHVEIRCRIVVELVKNSLDYLCLEQEELLLLQQLSDSYAQTPKETFELETLSVCSNSVYMGLWQLMAAANIFEFPILSVYPPLGPNRYRAFLNRRLVPRNQSSNVTRVIFWSATEHHQEAMPAENWTANHVVPMMCLTKAVQVDEL